MLSHDCGHIAILALFTLLGIWMMINHVPQGELVFSTFNSALFMRMQIKPNTMENVAVKNNPLSITQEKT